MSSSLLRFATHLLSPAGIRGRLTILIYHRVLAAPDPLQPDIPDVIAFDQQLRWLAPLFHVLPLNKALEKLKNGTLPARTACITFDDGYADNLIQALPVLQRHSMPATCFIATDYLDGGRMFNDTVIEAVRRAPATHYDLCDLSLNSVDLTSLNKRQQAIANLLSQLKYLPQPARTTRVAALAARLTSEPLPDHLMLTSAQLRTLHRSGMDIGAHTASHPILATLTAADAKADIARGKTRLEHLLDTDIPLFAYPNGKPGSDYTQRDVDTVRELGFAGAVSTAWGAATADCDSYQLPRFSPWAHQQLRFQWQLLRNLRHPVAP
ncbi:hypothetical protein CKO12_04430 [Chromatium okenii]|uniref:polysaccharide deacetylase family protein n=1 Tax=Chromatium okenii TaxID=61644 RepID=UPI0019054F0B|nr:polysaccharide deacetylase family protein [Chromatium okenii]MBK1641130.1 hypothetical protein [Chromatium okenii]